MKRHTVKQLAAISGVTVRTLHHYDEIGLLKPAYHGDNGYRYYEREQLLRLQEILFYRELGMPLQDIPAMLAASEADRVDALRGHRRRIEGELARFRRLIRTIDQTIDALEGGKPMQDKDFFEGFDSPKQAEYEAYLIDRYGEPTRARIAEAKRRAKDWSKPEAECFVAELGDIEADLAGAMAGGMAAEAPVVQEIVARHFRWVCHSWTPDAASYAGLGQLTSTTPISGPATRQSGRAWRNSSRQRWIFTQKTGSAARPSASDRPEPGTLRGNPSRVRRRAACRESGSPPVPRSGSLR